MADAMKLRRYRDYLENRAVVRRAIDQIAEAEKDDPKFRRALRLVLAKVDRQVAELQRGGEYVGHDGLLPQAKMLVALARDLRGLGENGDADPNLGVRLGGAAGLVGAGFDRLHRDAAWHRRALDFYRLAIDALVAAGSKNLGLSPDSPAVRIVARALQLTENDAKIVDTRVSKALNKGIKQAL
ncbi:MAG: hypothetical protein ACYCZB_03110 [Acidiphilium sp.]